MGEMGQKVGEARGENRGEERSWGSEKQREMGYFPGYASE